MVSNPKLFYQIVIDLLITTNETPSYATREEVSGIFLAQVEQARTLLGLEGYEPDYANAISIVVGYFIMNIEAIIAHADSIRNNQP